MPVPNEKLAAALAALAKLQEGGGRILESSEISRTHRDRLKKAGFVTPVIKGWWMATDPSAMPGDTTAWYASFWEFCGRYCSVRFGDDWHLGPDLSLLIHAEAMEVPRQVVVYAEAGTNNDLELPCGTNLFDYGARSFPKKEAITDRDGLRLFTLQAALVRVQPSFFQRHPVEAQVALAGIRDVSELLTLLLEGDHTTVAGRLVGALRRIGRDGMASEISETMTLAGHRIREVDPFEVNQQFPEILPRTPAVAARLMGMWTTMRGSVIERFPEPTMKDVSSEKYLQFVENIYGEDAYHSLSIEGYRVTAELIERVRTGEWDPEGNQADREARDALAVRGYWLAFQQVKDAVHDILLQPDAVAAIVGDQHRAWYRSLFQPAVTAGILRPADLAGYRSNPVYIQNSRHVPPRVDLVGEAMSALFDLMRDEEEASVRAVLGHWMLGYIHPFPDGNGRIARFLMNAMLASGGFPWTVIRSEDREAYMAAMEEASVRGDIATFADFIAGCVRASRPVPKPNRRARSRAGAG